jgi:hypothetical protein
MRRHPPTTRLRRADILAPTLTALAVWLAAGAAAQLTVQDNLRFREDDFDVVSFGADNFFGESVASCDFDGDGFADLAIGSPGADVLGVIEDAGAVHVAYGGPTGLTLSGAQTLTQPPTGPDPPEEGDRFGSSLTSGDFDGNGFCDLAVGSTEESLGPLLSAGSVQVFYGSPTGLDSDSQVWTQDTAGIQGVAETGDRFGWTLAAGDFDLDEFDDLVVTARGEDGTAGAVHVLFGSEEGLSASGDDYIRQGDPLGTLGTAESFDDFGRALAVGFFNGDLHPDLAIGAPGESDDGISEVGWIHVLYGEATGFQNRTQDLFAQGDVGLAPEELDRFGLVLAAGDFDDDGYDDLAAGTSREDVGPPGSESPDAGRLTILSGSATGLTTIARHWSQDSPGISDTVEIQDLFAGALAAGDFDGDGYVDLGVGVLREDFEDGGLVDNGALHALYGTAVGLTALREQFHGQGGWNLGAAEDDDFFGQRLTTGDFDGDGVDSLVIGIPAEDLSGLDNTGLVGVITGVFRDPMIFEDGFESGAPSAWDVVVD